MSELYPSRSRSFTEWSERNFSSSPPLMHSQRKSLVAKLSTPYQIWLFLLLHSNQWEKYTKTNRTALIIVCMRRVLTFVEWLNRTKENKFNVKSELITPCIATGTKFCVDIINQSGGGKYPATPNSLTLTVQPGVSLAFIGFIPYSVVCFLRRLILSLMLIGKLATHSARCILMHAVEIRASLSYLDSSGNFEGIFVHKFRS